MSDKSKIQWTEATWNPTRGCSLVSAGCTNCYAMRQAHRFSGIPGGPYRGFTRIANGHPVWTGKVELIEEALIIPLRWKRPRSIFVNSMSDLFHEALSFESIAAVFGVMAAAPHHTFQVLTKRAERMWEFFEWAAAEDGIDGGINAVTTMALGVPILNEYMTRNDRDDEMEDEGEYDHLITDPPAWPLSNAWLGISVEDQKTFVARWPFLRDIPAAVRWISYEPALDSVNFKQTLCGLRRREITSAPGDYTYDLVPKADWIVVGGESGPGARPFDVQWARDTIAQCKAAGVPVFVKQLGSRPTTDHRTRPAGENSYWPTMLKDKKGSDPAEWPEDLRVREYPDSLGGSL